MGKHNAVEAEVPVLLEKLLELLAVHRCAFGQERPYRRAMALVFGEVFAFARHTLTQVLLRLGPDRRGLERVVPAV